MTSACSKIASPMLPGLQELMAQRHVVLQEIHEVDSQGKGPGSDRNDDIMPGLRGLMSEGFGVRRWWSKGQGKGNGDGNMSKSLFASVVPPWDPSMVLQSECRLAKQWPSRIHYASI